MQSSQPVNLWHDISTASLYGRKWLTYGSLTADNVERRAIEGRRADFGPT